MITQKERKLLIMVLILLITLSLILALFVICLASQEEKKETQSTTISFTEVVETTEETEPETVPIVGVQPVTETKSISETQNTIAVKTLENISTENVTASKNMDSDDYDEEIEEESAIEEDTEFQDRCRLVYAESRGEIEEGQIAVAATLINREEHENFPDDFYGVMNQSGQFSPVWDGEIHVCRGTYYSVLKYEQVLDQTIEAVKKALNGEDPTEQLLWDEAVRLGLDPKKYAEGGALFFYNPAGCDWQQQAARANIKVKVQIGNHIFYKVWDK